MNFDLGSAKSTEERKGVCYRRLQIPAFTGEREKDLKN